MTVLYLIIRDLFRFSWWALVWMLRVAVWIAAGVITGLLYLVGRFLEKKAAQNGTHSQDQAGTDPEEATFSQSHYSDRR